MRDLRVGNVTFRIVPSKRNSEILKVSITETDLKEPVEVKLVCTREQLCTLGNAFVAASGKG